MLEKAVHYAGDPSTRVSERMDMCNRTAEDEIGRAPKPETAAMEAFDAPDPPHGHTGNSHLTGQTGPASAAVAPAVPSDQLQAGLSKPSRRPGWSRPTFRIWRGQVKPTDENASDIHAPPPTSRFLDWLDGLLERTEDAVDYLRTNLGRMSGKADPVAMAGSETGAQLRHMLDAQLETGASRSELVTATIAKRARFCTAIGGLFGLPGTVPGIGTAAQFVVGMAATWPESDLIRHQMWCLQVELLHLYGMAYAEADTGLLQEGSLNYEWINKGGEAFVRKLLTRLYQSTATATGVLDRFLVRVGASAALRESAGRILAKALPLGIGVAVGATVNYVKLHLFARRQLRLMQVTTD